jgi:uncharacterized protein
MYSWLLGNRWFGSYIRNYKEGRGLGLRAKIIALSVLWVTIGVSILFFLERLLPTNLAFIMQIIMLVVALVVSVHILRLPTLKNHKHDLALLQKQSSPYVREECPKGRRIRHLGVSMRALSLFNVRLVYWL